MSRTFKILPGPTSRTPSGTNAPAAACRFLESSANSFIFQGKQQYINYIPTGSSIVLALWQANQPFVTTSANYKPGSQQQIIQYVAEAPWYRVDLASLISETKLFPNLQVNEFEQIDLTLNGIDLSGIRTSPNFSFQYLYEISDFIVDEFPASPSLQSVLTGTTGSMTASKTLTLEESHIGTGTFVANNISTPPSYWLDSYCYARFGAYFSNTIPANAVWEYDRRTQTWSGPTHATPGIPDDNAFHLYIDWYFG